MNSPGVRFPPPILFVLAFAAAWLLETRVWRIPIMVSHDATRVWWLAGSALIVLGGSLVAWGMLTFVRARTGIIPNRPASQIVASGPYRFTRNPMYVGFTLVYLGAALLANMAWPFITLIAALWALTHFVIQREERYLTEAFGADYSAYRSQVRRWL